MNKDHQTEVVLYARHFAGLKLANAASITAIDEQGAWVGWGLDRRADTFPLPCHQPPLPSSLPLHTPRHAPLSDRAE
jgi:hypothetical protein